MKMPSNTMPYTPMRECMHLNSLNQIELDRKKAQVSLQKIEAALINERNKMMLQRAAMQSHSSVKSETEMLLRKRNSENLSGKISDGHNKRSHQKNLYIPLKLVVPSFDSKKDAARPFVSRFQEPNPQNNPLNLAFLEVMRKYRANNVNIKQVINEFNKMREKVTGSTNYTLKKKEAALFKELIAVLPKALNYGDIIPREISKEGRDDSYQYIRLNQEKLLDFLYQNLDEGKEEIPILNFKNAIIESGTMLENEEETKKFDALLDLGHSMEQEKEPSYPSGSNSFEVSSFEPDNYDSLSSKAGADTNLKGFFKKIIRDLVNTAIKICQGATEDEEILEGSKIDLAVGTIKKTNNLGRLNFPYSNVELGPDEELKDIVPMIDFEKEQKKLTSSKHKTLKKSKFSNYSESQIYSLLSDSPKKNKGKLVRSSTKKGHKKKNKKSGKTLTENPIIELKNTGPDDNVLPMEEQEQKEEENDNGNECENGNEERKIGKTKKIKQKYSQKWK